VQKEEWQADRHNTIFLYSLYTHLPRLSPPGSCHSETSDGDKKARLSYMRPFCRLVSSSAVSASFALLALVSLPAHAQTQALDFASQSGGITSNSSATFGWSFNLSTTINVTQLGVFDAGNNGFANSHQVGLWNSSQVLLASTTLASGLSGTPVSSASGTGSFRYAAVTNVVLTPGTYYLGAGYLANDVDSVFTGLPTLASGLTFDAARLTLSSFTFPSTSTAANGYFGPNFRFTAVSTAAPEPGSLALLLPIMGTAGMVIRKRRKK
jgi:hypothetical protein